MTTFASSPQLPDFSRSIWASPDPFRTKAAQGVLPSRADVVVVGAGIAGMACATELAQAGLDVVVLDAAEVGSGTTGHSTAKVSIVHGLHAHRIAQRDGSSAATDYIAANRHGLDWIARQVEQSAIDCGWQRRPGITYVTDPANDQRVIAEIDVMTGAGLDARRAELDLPFPTSAAIEVAHQGQFDPVRFVRGLASGFESGGGTLVEGCRATGISDRSSGVTVSTSLGDIDAGWAVVATGLPFVDRSGLFARTVARSSYLIACDVERLPADGMYLSADGPTRSLRTADVDDRTLLLVGGEGHRTGQGGDTRRNYVALADWADVNFGVNEVVSRFSAHDYTTPDLRAFVGPALPGRDRVLVATGFNKWGFTNAAAGAEVIRTTVTDEPPPAWAEVFSTSRLPLSGLGKLMSAGLDVGTHLVGGWLDGLRAHDRPSPGEGRVSRQGGRPVAVSADEASNRCAVSGWCTHLGGIVAWNPAEQTWDCPLHGSRFDRNGTMRHGPAVCDLAPLEP